MKRPGVAWGRTGFRDDSASDRLSPSARDTHPTNQDLFAGPPGHGAPRGARLKRFNLCVTKHLA